MSKVSIILAAYNSEKFISKTILSIIYQTFTDWELIIVDDGSTDETKNIISPFLKDARIHYYYQNNQRQARARNFAFQLSLGEYIAIIDHDDIWLPKKLEEQVKLLDINANCGLVYTALKLIDEEGTLLKTEPTVDVTKSPILLQFKANHIAFSSMLIRKIAIIGQFHDERYPQNGDLYLTINLLLNGWKFGFINEPLLLYRISNNSLSHNFQGVQIYFTEQMNFYNDILVNSNSPLISNHHKRVFLSNSLISFGRYIIRYKQFDKYKKARSYIFKGISINPSPELLYSGFKGIIKSILYR